MCDRGWRTKDRGEGKRSVNKKSNGEGGGGGLVCEAKTERPK